MVPSSAGCSVHGLALSGDQNVCVDNFDIYGFHSIASRTKPGAAKLRTHVYEAQATNSCAFDAGCPICVLYQCSERDFR